MKSNTTTHIYSSPTGENVTLSTSCGDSVLYLCRTKGVIPYQGMVSSALHVRAHPHEINLSKANAGDCVTNAYYKCVNSWMVKCLAQTENLWCLASASWGQAPIPKRSRARAPPPPPSHAHAPRIATPPTVWPAMGPPRIDGDGHGHVRAKPERRPRIVAPPGRPQRTRQHGTPPAVRRA